MPIIDLEAIMVKLLNLPVIRQLLQGIVRSANDEQVKEIDGLKNEKLALENEKKKLSTDLEKFKTAYNTWKAKAESLERDKATLTAQIADKDKEIAALKQAYEQKLTVQRTACEEQVKRILSEKQQALEEQKKTLDDQHQAEMTAKDQELTSTKVDLKESQKNSRQLEKALDGLTQTYVTCKGVKEKLEAAIQPALRIQELYGSLSAEAREQLSSRYPRTDLLGLVCCGVQERYVELLRDWCRTSFLKEEFLSESDKLCELYTTFFELSHPEVDGQPSCTLESPMLGGEFDARYHEKVERNVSRGKIVKVLLPMLRDGEGTLEEKALVSVSATRSEDDSFGGMGRMNPPRSSESLAKPGKVQTESTGKDDEWSSF